MSHRRHHDHHRHDHRRRRRRPCHHNRWLHRKRPPEASRCGPRESAGLVLMMKSLLLSPASPAWVILSCARISNNDTAARIIALPRGPSDWGRRHLAGDRKHNFFEVSVSSNFFSRTSTLPRACSACPSHPYSTERRRLSPNCDRRERST